MEAIFSIPVKGYNAAFTAMGRKNLRNRLKMYRANQAASFQKEGTFIYKLKNGNRFVLHRENDLSELIYLEGTYEPLESLIMSSVVLGGDIVLDIGANIGYYTALLDGLVKPGGQVHAFEPGAGTFVKLKETQQLLNLGCTVLHNKAISDSAGYIDFWTSTSGSDAQQSTVKVVALGQGIAQSRVEATTLDSFAGELRAKTGKDIAFVKCDIEGAELSMIGGARGLISSGDSPVWLIEHNRAALTQHGNSSADLTTPFPNFDIYHVSLSWPPSLMPSRQAKKWTGVPDDLPDECNLILVPKSGAFANRSTALRRAGLIP